MLLTIQRWLKRVLEQHCPVEENDADSLIVSFGGRRYIISISEASQ